MKNIIIMSIVVVALCTFLVLRCSKLTNELTEAVNLYKTEMSSYVGKQILIQTDTLLIVDFDVWNGKFILSNGIKVDATIVDDNIIREEGE